VFGFFDGITQRLGPERLVLALLLAAALLLFAGTLYALVTKGLTALKLLAAGLCAFGIFVILRGLFFELGDSAATLALWLIAGAVITAAGVVAATRYRGVAVAVMAMAAVAALFVYLWLDEIPDEFVPMLPYVVTLVVVSSRGQALRPPAEAGEPWFKGQQ
jgi:simple sugar transport system permease protein